mmetsp:Transcript_15841/g.35239  ORF Transcript_15841/g.35239 Transcript_15841/m.35239 type:complete len:284 (-) Transcript_15841:96-947(-)
MGRVAALVSFLPGLLPPLLAQVPALGRIQHAVQHPIQGPHEIRNVVERVGGLCRGHHRGHAIHAPAEVVKRAHQEGHGGHQAHGEIPPGPVPNPALYCSCGDQRLSTEPRSPHTPHGKTVRRGGADHRHQHNQGENSIPPRPPTIRSPNVEGQEIHKHLKHAQPHPDHPDPGQAPLQPHVAAAVAADLSCQSARQVHLQDEGHVKSRAHSQNIDTGLRQQAGHLPRSGDAATVLHVNEGAEKPAGQHRPGSYHISYPKVEQPSQKQPSSPGRPSTTKPEGDKP